MKVLLINPPYSRLRGSGQSAFFPLGIGYLAGALAREGFEPVIYSAENPAPDEPLPQTRMREVFDLRSEGHRNYVEAIRNDGHHVWQELRNILEEHRPNLVGISALSVQFGSAAKVAQVVKSWNRDCPVVLGGHHVTYMPEISLKTVPEIDVGVLGEGESTLAEICRAYDGGRHPDFSAIPGLVYRTEGGAAFSKARPLCPDLDRIPNPRRDLVLFPERFAPSHFSPILYGRGCPWRCRFCSSKEFWQRRVRTRSPGNCLDEIRQIVASHGVRHFVFWDDAFNVRPDTIRDFCEAAIRSDLDFTFRTATRADLAMDEDLLASMKSAGCVELTLGVESGSPRVLKQIRKDLDLDTLRQAMSRVRRQGMAASTFFMAGFPRESVLDLEATFALIRELKSARIVLNVFDPMPGSELYDECVELGLVPPDADWRDFPLWPDRHFVTEMSHEEFDTRVRRLAAYVFRRDIGLFKRILRHLPLLRINPREFARNAMRALAPRRRSRTGARNPAGCSNRRERSETAERSSPIRRERRCGQSGASPDGAKETARGRRPPCS